MSDEKTPDLDRIVQILAKLIQDANKALADEGVADVLALPVPVTQLRMLAQPGEIEFTFKISGAALAEMTACVFDDPLWSEEPTIGDVGRAFTQQCTAIVSLLPSIAPFFKDLDLPELILSGRGVRKPEVCDA